MNRIDSFDVEPRWNDDFSRAELVSGRAAALRSLEVTNVRGGPRSWLMIRVQVDGAIVGRARVEDVPLGGSVSVDLSNAVLPCDLAPGAHLCRLEIRHSGGCADLSHPFEVLPDDHICLRMNQAGLLAAHVATSGAELSDFADAATQGIDSRDRLAVLCALYDALRARNLPYQPVAKLIRGDYQRIRGAVSTLRFGGSCADLSLLFAGLCYLKGLSPVLLMLQDHMMAGAWLIDPPSAVPVTGNASLVQELADSGALLLLEVTSLCAGRTVEQAVEDARARLAPDAPMVLADVCAALRSGVRTVSQSPSAPASPATALVCDRCGYDRFAPEELSAPAVSCPACGRLLTVPDALRTLPERPSVADGPAPDVDSPETEVPRPRPVEPARPQVLSGELARCRIQGGVAVAAGAPAAAETVRVPDTWQGRPVTKIIAQAFDGCRMTSAILPDGLTVIGDYAFRRCGRLTEIVLPDGLTGLGAGAFSGCGALTAARIPGSLRRIPRAAFSHCAALSHVTLDDGVEEIDECAFEGCASLVSISLPASVRRVHANAFSGCAHLAEVRLGSDATLLDPRAFAGSPLDGR